MLLALIFAATTAVGYPPQGYTLMHSEDSPRHSFSVEEYASDSGTSVWLHNRDGGLAQLYARSGSPIEPYVYISPDERWIVCVQKLYHGASAAWLYERAGALHYSEVTPSPFSDQAWKFLRAQTHRSFEQDYHYFIQTGAWLPKSHSLLIDLSGNDGRTLIKGWSCYYDLEKRRFYIDAALKKRNQNAVSSATHKEI